MRDLDTKLAASVQSLLRSDLDDRITGVYVWPVTGNPKRPYIVVETDRQNVADATARGDLWRFSVRVTVKATKADSTELFGSIEGGLGISRDLFRRLNNAEINVRLCLFDQPSEKSESADGWERSLVFTADAAHICP